MSAVARRWTKQEIAALKQLRGENVIQLAQFFGRSVHSVKARLDRARKTERARKYRQMAEVVRIRIEPLDVPPPDYVLREREIRSQIVHQTRTAAILGDPLPGYTAKDAKRRRLSVQDALEIRALYSDRPGEKVDLRSIYRISPHTLDEILSGEWFERLLPTHKLFDENL